MRERVVGRLDDLSPKWVAIGESWGAGVTFTCPTHQTHPCTILFANPVDGFDVDHQASAIRYNRTGASFSTMTLHSELNLGACFNGWLVDGELLVAQRAH